MTIGQRVLYELSQKGLRQSDLAEFLGTTPSTVNGWSQENRNPSSNMILPICEFLECSCEYLLSGKESEEAQRTREDREILRLFHRLPRDARIEFKGEIKGYLKAIESEEDDPLDGTTAK